jgi:branched-chain amino acid transport system ATP-binding protein
VEQNFNFSRRLGQTVAVMNDGAVVHAGTMAELAENDELQQDLLGLGLGAHQ